ncbi:MAG: FAD-binding domain-containing protein [Cyanobacteria bacterium J06627_32]
MNRTLVWFRRDLRISDHEPLYRAARRGAVIPVFVFDRALLLHPETGSGRVRFMLSCLKALDQDLRRKGGRLILRAGDPVDVLPRLVKETSAEGIYSYVDFERIYGRVRDARLNQALAEEGLKIRWFEPQGTTSALISYPQYRQLWHQQMRSPQVPTPQTINVPPDVPSDDLPKVEKLGHHQDAMVIPPGGTTEARKLLNLFFDRGKAESYYWQLSYPGTNATSGLSPYIKYGAISIRECAQRVWARQAEPHWANDKRVQRSSHQLISRLRWGSGFTQRFRYLPQLEVRSLYTPFESGPLESGPANTQFLQSALENGGWDYNLDHYEAWKAGQTGYPIVDAAARCLQETGGWLALNFRVRAIYASFLCNLIGMDWRYGALHFMRYLIDGDCPIDHYQWAQQAGVTHCLNKAWIRIYNPEQEAIDRCDPQGKFVHRWVPELRHLKPEQLGTPPKVKGYPAPILNYAEARARRAALIDELRFEIIHAPNIEPLITRLPEDVTPFGADLFPSDVRWAQQPIEALYPTALDLDSLEKPEFQMLRTWFIAHGSWLENPKRQQIAKQKNRQKRKEKQHDGQLSLLS